MKKYFKHEQELAQTGKVTLNLSVGDDATQILSSYLRDHHGRADLANQLQLLKPDSMSEFTTAIESIRNLLIENKLEKAKQLIDTTATTDIVEKLEIILELGRYHYFKGDYQLVVNSLNFLIKQPETLPLTRLTAMQLIGISNYCLGNVSSATQVLEKVLNMWELFPYAHSGASGAAHLVKMYSEQGSFAAAQTVLHRMEMWLENLEDSDHLLTKTLLLMRARFHYWKNQNKMQEAKESLWQSYLIAMWLEDWEVIQACEKDLCEFGLTATEKSVIVIDRLSYTYLPLEGIVLAHSPKRFFSLKNKNVLKSIVDCLVEKDLSEEELFTRVWKLRYDKGRHSSHVRMSLSKLRKHLPIGALLVRDGVISLAE